MNDLFFLIEEIGWVNYSVSLINLVRKEIKERFWFYVSEELFEPYRKSYNFLKGV